MWQLFEIHADTLHFEFSYFLQRFPIGKFIGFTTLAWGILMITTPASTNFAGIASIRFLLGATEAIVNPGFVLVSAVSSPARGAYAKCYGDTNWYIFRQVLAMWWKVEEQPMRLVTYYCMNGFAGIFGGLLGYAIVRVLSEGVQICADRLQGHITTGLERWRK